MAYELTQYLRLRLDSGLTAAAKANLRKIDDLGSRFYVTTDGDTALRSIQDITIVPNDASLGGSGTGGTVEIGSSGHTIASLTAYATISDFVGTLRLKARNELRFADSDSSNYVGFRAAATVASDVLWTLPSADGISGQVLGTNAAGVLSWLSLSSIAGSVALGSQVSGTLPIANGGTGAATAAAAINALLPSQASATGQTLHSNGTSAYWAAAGTGTVTSVALTAPAIFSVAGSPVTTSGTLALSLATQAANRIWAGPSTGADAAPTFRALVIADLPTAIPYANLALTGAILNADLAGSIAYSKLSLTGAILNADLAGSIAYSKLVLTGSVVNADIGASAAIAYSKLALAASIVNADVSASAAIAYSKLALTGAILNADLAGSIAYSKLSLTGSIVNADVGASAAIAYSKLNLATSIVNADINASAAIAYSKLALSASIATGDLASGLLVPLTKGGTGQTTANAALNALLPSQASASGKVLSSNGTDTSWAAALTTTLSSGHIFVGNGSDVATDVAMSGDVTISNAGVTAIGSGKVTNAMLAGSIAYSKLSLTGAILNADLAGSIAYSKLNLAGSIATADLASGLLVPISNGGTGQTSKAAAFDALSPMTTAGDIIYGGASGTGTRLAAGTKGHRLRSTGTTAPIWGFGSVNVVSSAGYTILDNDGYDVIAVSTGASNRSIVFPAAANNTGRRITIIKTDSGAGNVALTGTGSGFTNEAIYTQYAQASIISDGTSWFYESDMCEQGTWTTGFAVSTNVTGTPTVTKAWFSRRGNMVFYQFKVTGCSVTTGSSTRSIVTFNVPIATRTSGDPKNGVIAVSGATEDRGIVIDNSSTTGAAATWLASITGAVTFFVSGSYALL